MSAWLTPVAASLRISASLRRRCDSIPLGMSRRQPPHSPTITSTANRADSSPRRSASLACSSNSRINSLRRPPRPLLPRSGRRTPAPPQTTTAPVTPVTPITPGPTAQWPNAATSILGPARPRPAPQADSVTTALQTHPPSNGRLRPPHSPCSGRHRSFPSRAAHRSRPLARLPDVARVDRLDRVALPQEARAPPASRSTPQSKTPAAQADAAVSQVN